jgi:hypothetical protein
LNPRTTGILFLVAALLGAGIWFSNRHELEKKEAEDQAKKLFGTLTAEQVEWIALRTSDGKDARLERRDGAWHLAAPIEFPADAATADGFASALAGLVSESVIEDAQPLSVYGLDADEKTLRFRAGGADHELRVGKKTPIGANNYAATGPDGSVYAIATYRATSFEKPLDDLRERRPLRFDRDGVAHVEVSWSGGGVTLDKKDGTWRITAPLETEADAETVEALLSDLVFLRASSFLDAPPPDAEVGLDPPAYRVVLLDAPQDGKPPLRHEVAIGGARDGQLRVVRGAEPSLYQVPDERYEKLPKSVVAFRHKTLASFVATDAQRFELSFADPGAEGASQVVTVEGSSSDGDGWTTKPDTLKDGLAARIVAEVARLKAEDIAADSMGPDELAGVGLSPPRATLRIFGKPSDGGAAPELAAVLFGVVKGGKIYAKVPSRPTVYALSDALAEHVPMSLEAYRNHFVAPPESADAPADPADAAVEDAAMEATPPDAPADGGGMPGEAIP